MPKPKHHTERELRQQNEALRKALRRVLVASGFHSALCHIFAGSNHPQQCDCAIGAARAYAEFLLEEKI